MPLPRRSLIAALGLLLAGVLTAQPAPAPRIREARFVPIGGQAQWITIQGERRDNPVILMLHGGPGNPLTPYADAMYGAWEKNFTLVQWDQRGAGRTFGRNPGTADTELTLARMTQDGIELATYLTRTLKTPKLILMGGSWSSVLAVHMVKARPDLFHAYVGSAQLVHHVANPTASVAALKARAQAAGDAKTLAALEALGTPPWTNPRAFGAFRRLARAAEAKATTPAPAAWWEPAPAYATPQDLADAEAGEDYSYLQFVGPTGQGMFAQVDLPRLGTAFPIPIFLLQGEEDLVTTPAVAKAYLDSLTAPQKAWTLLPRTGHDPNAALVDAQYTVLTTRVRPLIQGGTAR